VRRSGRQLFGILVLLVAAAEVPAQDVSELIENPGFEQGNAITVASLRNKVVRLTIFARTQTSADGLATVFFRVDRNGEDSRFP
jgi:hypothetical protein